MGRSRPISAAWFDEVAMRIVDTVLASPFRRCILAMAIVAALVPSIQKSMLAPLICGGRRLLGSLGARSWRSKRVISSQPHTLSAFPGRAFLFAMSCPALWRRPWS